MSISLQELRSYIRLRNIEWQGIPVDPDLLYCAVELGGEAGEALNKVKKLIRVQKGIKGGEKEAAKEAGKELADVVISAVKLADSLGLDLETEIFNKFNETSEKHGFHTVIK